MSTYDEHTTYLGEPVHGWLTSGMEPRKTRTVRAVGLIKGVEMNKWRLEVLLRDVQAAEDRPTADKRILPWLAIALVLLVLLVAGGFTKPFAGISPFGLNVAAASVLLVSGGLFLKGCGTVGTYRWKNRETGRPTARGLVQQVIDEMIEPGPWGGSDAGAEVAAEPKKQGGKGEGEQREDGD